MTEAPHLLTSSEIRTLLAILAGATSITEICAATGRSRSATHKHLRSLRALGWVSWVPGNHRTLRPTVAITGTPVRRPQ